MHNPLPRSARPRRWLVGVFTVLTLTVVVVAGYRRQTARRDRPPAPSAHVLSPHSVTVVPGIHLLGGLAPAAAYVVETSDGLVLVDAGLHAGAVKREMASLGLDWKRLRAIFLTHVHGDHCGGAQELREATGAKVYAGQGDAAVLRAGRPRVAYFSTFYMPSVPTPGPTTVDVELAGDQTITVGDVRFRALATPGHTPGSVCYLMERGDQRVLFSGDVIWALSDDDKPLGTYAAHLAPRYRGDAEAFLATLRRLRALPAPQLVLPGHPRNDPVPQSPALSQQRWEALLDAGIREMEVLLERYARDGANFLDGLAKKLRPDLYYLGDCKGVAVYGFFAASKFFLVNAPGPGLVECVNAGLRKAGVGPATPAAVLLTACDPEQTAGLAELVEKYHPRVVAPPATWKEIKKSCPAADLLAPEDLAGKGWFPVKVMELRGRGAAGAAYLLPWAGKSVLFSGRVPVKPTDEAGVGLVGDFRQGRVHAADYLASLRLLGNLNPNLWLPATAYDGQNANLYDGEWRQILAGNGNAVLRFR